ncbi:MAG TPA: hypothetical protein VHF69_01940, partial [Candidatus Synoicihabitans sp.]|nr:hypothetical protein [Candidatus Synoicihabitans sp.]
MSTGKSPRQSRTICLVTPAHLTMNPRVVKEAEALSAAGYRVHVIAGWFVPAFRQADAAIVESADWTWRPVDLSNRAAMVAAKIARLLARRRLARQPRTLAIRWAARAHSAATGFLARA